MAEWQTGRLADWFYCYLELRPRPRACVLGTVRYDIYLGTVTHRAIEGPYSTVTKSMSQSFAASGEAVLYEGPLALAPHRPPELPKAEPLRFDQRMLSARANQRVC